MGDPEATSTVPLNDEDRKRLLLPPEDMADLEDRIREIRGLPGDQAVAMLRTLRELECERYKPRVEQLKRIARAIREVSLSGPDPDGEEIRF